MLRLNLGCGNYKKEGYINIDKIKTPATDRIIDLDTLTWYKQDFFNNVDEIWAHHIIEHLKNLIDFFNTLYLICEPNAKIHLFFPKAGTDEDFADPTHKQHICLKTIQNFC